MPITRPDFDDVAESDISELVTAGTTEGIALEFKETSYGNGDSDKRELLKDVSAFANANGGHLVIGIKETGGVASDVCGIRVADIDAEVRRLDQIVRSGLEPRIPACRFRAVALIGGSHAIVVRIGRSWRIPHRVSAQNSFRFWIRNSGGCHEASMDELRTMFGEGAALAERARSFRDERIARIREGRGPRPVDPTGRVYLHLIPHSSIASPSSIDVVDLYKGHSQFPPIGSMGVTSRYNFDGVINEKGGEPNAGYTQLFRTGAVEATQANLAWPEDGHSNIAGLKFESELVAAIASYLQGMKILGTEPPITIFITLDGVAGAYYHVLSNQFPRSMTPFDREIIHLPNCVVSEYGEDDIYHAAIRPAFDALWNAVGFAKDQFFNESSRWVGPKS
jgi:hypothetical protein